MAELESIDEWLTPDFGYRLQARLLHREQTPFQQLEIWQSETFGKMLRLDGALQCSENDEFFYHEPMVHLAALAHPQPRTALVIGGGDGGSAEELLKHRDLASVTLVEVDRRVVECARVHLRAIHGGVIDESGDPRVRIEFADGRAFLANRPETYDLIVLDLTDPGGASSKLYGADFYRLCASRLNAGGMLTLHLAALWPDVRRVHERLRTLGAAFRSVEVFVFSVPMSGGPWVMARCGNADSPPIDRETATATRREQALGGSPLRFIRAQHLHTLRIPPRLLDAGGHL